MARNMGIEKNYTNFYKTVNVLFYCSKIFGVIPFDLLVYYHQKIFRLSILGNIYCLLAIVVFSAEHHFVKSAAYFKGGLTDTGTLTLIIGIFIVYMEPAMMAVDIIATIINQKKLIQCIKRMEEIDKKLCAENISINYKQIKNLSYLLIALAMARTITIIVLCVIFFPGDSNNFGAFFSVFVSTLSKIWFVIIIYNIHEKFNAINDYLKNLSETLKKRDENPAVTINPNINSNLVSNSIHSQSKPANKSDISIISGPFGYLQKEIAPRRKSKQFLKKLFDQKQTDVKLVKPYPETDGKKGDQIDETPAQIYYFQNFLHENPNDALIVGDKFDKKLTTLCKLHDEICEVAKVANSMFSFQMLALMAYGFIYITAQLYFVYCGLVGQAIPALFRFAENLLVSFIYLSTTAAKCVYVIYICWQTKIASQRTGVFLHKVANVVDENHFYEVTNHLSLKLLNHRLNFTACGFFDMDMTTVYAITGAITSYLIILIQFNVAAQRSKKQFLNGTDVTNGTST